MKPVKILKDFNSCYVKIQAIAQSPQWLDLIAQKEIDPDAATHVSDVLHYLEAAIRCVEEVVEVNQEVSNE